MMLTDIVMPGMDGITLAVQATKDNPQMSVTDDDRLCQRGPARDCAAEPATA